MRARSGEPPDAASPFRWLLRDVLHERGLSAPHFAARLRAAGHRISASQVYRLLQYPPRRYDAHLLAAICQTLGCGLDVLLQYDPLAGDDELPPPFRLPGT